MGLATLVSIDLVAEQSPRAGLHGASDVFRLNVTGVFEGSKLLLRFDGSGTDVFSERSPNGSTTAGMRG